MINKSKIKNILIYIAVPLLLAIIIATMWGMNLGKTRTKYSQLLDLFRQDKVAEYRLNIAERKLVYYLRSDTEKGIVYEVPDSNLFIQDVRKISEEIEENKSKDNKTPALVYDFERGDDGAWLFNLIPTLIIIISVVGVFFFLNKRMSGMDGGDKTMNFGKAKFKSTADERRKTLFSDVAGADEEKEELSEIVDFLKNPQRFNELGARIPKGVLLVGPPGTGKTLLARAVAGEAGVPFFSISGSDFVEMFVGVGASRVRDLFQQAKKNAPAIVFIDEIDAVGRQRGAGLGGGHDEREQTLNQLLVEMDGFGANEGVIIIAATNRPDILDKALLRPGRFDRQVTVNYPDVKGREEILKVHSRGKPLGPDVDLKTIAKSTSGFTGADLENLLNEAALLAARQNKKAITEENIEEATIKVVMGTEKKSHVITDHDKWITSYHEAGHAVVSYFLPTQDPVHQISIIPRGMAAGYTMYIPDRDDRHVSKNKMLEDICSLLGGRAAEQLTQDDICTGASNDIKRATENARMMVTQYGFSEKIGPIALGNDQSEVFLGRDFSSTPNYSEKISAVIDEEIERIVTTQYEKAIKLLTEHMDELKKVAEILFNHEKIDGDDFRLLMEGKELSFDNDEEKAEKVTETVEQIEE
ncbi:MAG: ATP-dependent zinc metalloprotease FtsH [Clostridia bacterium]|nr:ATP-dependent zinc metalloprotease FtsH [Clostridia bacterium]